jgi:cytochrome P450
MLDTATSLSPVLAPTKALPKTKGFPLLGSLPALLQDPFRFMVAARATYGDIYTLDLGVSKAVVLNHPRHAQYILRDNAHNYRKGGPMWDAVRDLLGNGLLVSEGDFWLRQRRMMQPQFHRQHLAGLTNLMVEAINEALNTWEQAATQGTNLDLPTAFNRLTMKVIVKTLFGTALSASEMDEFAEAMTFALDYMVSAMVTKPLPKWLPIPGKKRFQAAIAVADALTYRMIRECREGQSHNDMLALLLNTVDEETGEAMTDQQLRDEILTLFLAGYETTSIALSWAYYYLAQHPETMQKLYTEVDTVLAGRQPTFADLPNLPYSRMVLSEAMRLRPPSWWHPRTAVADDEIDGYPIPAGTQVISLTYMYHRHPEMWDNPEAFDPERFAPENAAQRHKFAWIPFGAGQRLCLGRDFAIMEGQLALALIAQRYHVRPATERPVEPMLSSTLRPKGGIPATITKRA